MRRTTRQGAIGGLFGWVLSCLMLVIAVGLAPLAPASAAKDVGPFSDDAVEISDGYVTWGIKYSWRKYAWGGQTLSGGVEITDPIGDEKFGQYRWPIESGTYDPETKTTVLNLGGAIHYKLYCDQDDPDLCALDSKFQDLQVIISPDEQIIHGTYIGIPREDPGGYKQRYEGVLAKLKARETDPTTSDNTTVWEGIPAVAGEQLQLYPEDTPIDPVSFTYTGPSGKPYLPEVFAKPGTPLYEQTREWNSSEKGEILFFPMGDKTQIMVSYPRMFKDEETGERQVKHSFIVVDAETLEPVIDPVDFSPPTQPGWRPWVRGPVTWDPDTNTMFFQVSLIPDEAGAAYRYEIHAVTWDQQAKEFEFSLVEDYAHPAGMTGSYNSGVFSWDGANKRFLVSARTIVDATGEQINQMWQYTRGPAGWVKTTAPLDMPTGAPEVPQDIRDKEVLSGKRGPGCDVWIGDHLICPQEYFYKVDGKKYGTPTLEVWQDDTGTWKSRYIPNTIPKDTAQGAAPKYAHWAFNNIQPSASGGVILTGSGSAAVSYYDDLLAGGDPVYLEPNPGAKWLGIAGANPDMENGFDFIHSWGLQKVYVIKDREVLTSFKVGDIFTIGRRSTVLKPGTFYTTEGRGYDVNTVLRKYEITARAGVVTQDPVDQTVALTDGATSQPVTFTMDYTAVGDSMVKWQEKTIGSQYFTDIEGAEGTSLSVDATLADDGTMYRAVIVNPAGKVKTESALLSVASAPRYLSTPEDTSVEIGQQATFSAPVDPDIPADSQTWQMLTPDGWVDLGGQDGITIDGDTITIEASLDRDGMQVRSVIANQVGSNTSDPATLTVTEPAQAPQVNQHPASIQVNVGEPVTFTAAATGSPEPAVVWQEKIADGPWRDIEGATSTSYVIDQADLAQSGVSYRAVFTNEAGSVASEPAMLTVVDPTPAPEPQPEPEPEPSPEPDPSIPPAPWPDQPDQPDPGQPAPDQPDQPDQPDKPAPDKPGPDQPAKPAPSAPVDPGKDPGASQIDHPGMPHTGATVWIIAVIALALLAAGGGLIYLRKHNQ